MFESIETGNSKILGVKLSGKLHEEDYKTFIPWVENALATTGKLSLFIRFEDFHGWDLGAAWEDLKFATQHYGDFDRIAMVGESRWQEWMAKVSRPFTQAAVKYFDVAETEQAWAWLRDADQAQCQSG
ncbi:MAG: STAS/SEC14 domain-containing protein [Methylococcus sp.]|nr:STAS/SEC14 domain-containing protein [Methylococcus sp.]